MRTDPNSPRRDGTGHPADVAQLRVTSLGLRYVAAFVLVYQSPRAQRWLRMLAPVGRMALTNFLLQTVCGLTFFYGSGFCLGPWHGLPAVVRFAFVIFALQIVFSSWVAETIFLRPLRMALALPNLRKLAVDPSLCSSDSFDLIAIEEVRGGQLLTLTELPSPTCAIRANDGSLRFAASTG